MTHSNAIREIFDKFARSENLEKRSGSWYQRGDDLITVLELQKSNFGDRYFVNIAIWLTAIEPASFPKENKCHIRTRLTELVPDASAVDGLLNLDTPLDDAQRVERLNQMFREQLNPILQTTTSLGKLGSLRGQEFLSHCLVRPAAQALIDSSPWRESD